METRIRAFLEFSLPTTMASDSASHARAVLASSSGGVKGGSKKPKADLKLDIFLSYLEIMVLGYPPLLEETPGIIAVVRVEGIRRRGRRRRCSIRGLAGPRKRTKAVIQDEPINKVEEFTAMSRRYRSLPHTSKALVHRHVLLWNLLHRTFASVVFADHEVWLDLQEGEENRYRVAEKCE